MSLNWQEIDKVLSELPLEGLHLQRVRQPDYRRMIFEFSGPGITLNLSIVLATPFLRLHRIQGALPPALPRPPRFNALLKSRLEGARLNSVHQLSTNRIVRFGFSHRGEKLFLDAKLWGAAANLILFTGDSLIIDAFTRRPGRGEIPGARWSPETGLSNPAGPELSKLTNLFPIRPLSGAGDFNSRVAAHYASLENLGSTEKKTELWHNFLKREQKSLNKWLAHIEENLNSFEQQLQCSHWADLLLASFHEIPPSSAQYTADDWDSPGTRLTDTP